MKYKNNITGTIISIAMIFAMAGCEERWQDHYLSTPETVNENVWAAIQNNQDLTSFVEYIKENKYDTLFLSNDSYTLFIPDNEAIVRFREEDEVTTRLLDYHISRHVIQSSSITGKVKVQTLAEKFALLDNTGANLLFDDIAVSYESPLYENGKYFILSEVGFPRPNIYEYFAANNPILKSYIDDLDSIIVDMEKSRPIGFDEEGNTIFDTVAIIYNEFEEEFFPVRKEFRNRTATIVFPNEPEYNQALTEMAEFMGTYQDHTDIPVEWQKDILIPYLLEQGVFENMIEERTFRIPTNRDTVKMKNILGDSVIIEYTVANRVICSNGYVYSYENFQVPDTLYKGAVNFEGESLLRETGINRYAWRENVTIVSDMAFTPNRDYNANASNDSLFRVAFPSRYSGTYSIEFKIRNLFPRKYLMVVGTNMNVGGIYDIFVNDELVRTMDWADYQRFRGQVLPSVTGELARRHVPRGTLNSFDAFVDNKAEYGETRVRFVYKEPGNVLLNGLALDNIMFIPYDF
ncbi:MAG: hypothetical protein EA408_12395 [Marinilabiliales bacterium]|nr:MAG: hypothetical protein EA408_12395 [Marinilabiliales bacterium]